MGSSSRSEKGKVQKDEDKNKETAAKKDKAGQPSRNGGGSADAHDVGDRVRVGGLNGAVELNGKCAVVFSYDKQSGRYLVEFENGAGQRKLKLENLTAMGTSNGALSAKARMLAGL